MELFEKYLLFVQEVLNDIEIAVFLQLLAAIGTAMAAMASWKAARTSKENVQISERKNQREIEPEIYLDSKRFEWTYEDSTLIWKTKDGDQEELIGNLQKRAFSNYFIELYNLGGSFAKGVGVYFETPYADKLFDSPKDLGAVKIMEHKEERNLKHLKVVYKRENSLIVETKGDGTQLFNFLPSYNDLQSSLNVKLLYKFILPIEMYFHNYLKPNERVLEAMGLEDILDYNGEIVVKYQNLYNEKREKRFKIMLSSINTGSGMNTTGSFDIVEIER